MSEEATNGVQTSPEEGEKTQAMRKPVVYNYRVAKVSKGDSTEKALGDILQMGKEGFRLSHIHQTAFGTFYILEQELILIPPKQQGPGILVPEGRL